VKRGLGTPAILFLQTVVPLNYIGAQVLVFFKPFASAVFDPVSFNKFAMLLERRETIPKLVLLLEERLSEVKREEENKDVGEVKKDESENH